RLLVCLNRPLGEARTRRHARIEGDVHFRHASLELGLDRDDGGFGDLGDGETGGLDLLRAQAVTRDIDHVIDTAEDAVIAIGRLHRAVAAQERPVTPVFAPGVLVVLAVVRFDVAVVVAPDRLHDARPRVADTHVARLAGPFGTFRPGFVVDDRM